VPPGMSERHQRPGDHHELADHERGLVEPDLLRRAEGLPRDVVPFTAQHLGALPLPSDAQRTQARHRHAAPLAFA
jgi:hypothetical protein